MPREIGVFSDIWHSHQRLCERGRSTRIHRRLNSQPLAQYFPHAVLARIEAETAKALASPEMARLFTERAFDPMPIPRAELPGFVAGESQRWRDAVRQSGAKAE